MIKIYLLGVREERIKFTYPNKCEICGELIDIVRSYVKLEHIHEVAFKLVYHGSASGDICTDHWGELLLLRRAMRALGIY